MAGKYIVEAFFHQHFDRFVQAVEQMTEGVVGQ